MNMQNGRVGLGNERKGKGVSPLKRWKNSMLLSNTRWQNGRSSCCPHFLTSSFFSGPKIVPYLSDGASYIEIRVTVCNWEDGPAVASFIHTGDAGGGTGGRARGLGRAVRCAPGLRHGAQAALTQSVMLKPKKHKYLETKIIYAT